MTETEFTLIILSSIAVVLFIIVWFITNLPRNDRLDKERQRWKKIRKEMKK